ncbi:hypothetical protein M436DRAFT_59416 [Aureobasidium namibiae CBS 147.97]|uniref:Uncharacterized protein n=1 Tax=Aureobasidium namibiae CBS 147.97 TaxID=1043004 RepID=A0A074XS69_9PEZI
MKYLPKKTSVLRRLRRSRDRDELWFEFHVLMSMCSWGIPHQAARESLVVSPTPVSISQLLDHKSPSALSLFSRPSLAPAIISSYTMRLGQKRKQTSIVLAPWPSLALCCSPANTNPSTLSAVDQLPRDLVSVSQNARCPSSTGGLSLRIPLRSSLITRAGPARPFVASFTVDTL